jgi:hypothetical protein
MKRYGPLMLLTGMTLIGCASAFGQTAPPWHQFPIYLGYGDVIGFILNRRCRDPVRFSASFGGRTGP